METKNVASELRAVPHGVDYNSIVIIQSDLRDIH